ncbi:MAG: hypothetical protein AB7P02_15695 [Alphaproteobacteria bacterium]
MGAFIRALAAARFAARARMQVRLLAMRAAVGAVAVAVGGLGILFLLLAGYQTLGRYFLPPYPALIIGGGLIVIAALACAAMALSAKRLRRRAPPSAAASVEPLMAAANTFASKIPSSVVAAALAGFAYGMSRRR